jgi:hypothetical protein
MTDTLLDDDIPLPEPTPDPWGGRDPARTVSFLVHDAAGQILRTGYCALRDLQSQAGPGETVLEGQANDRLHKVVSGAVARKTSEEIAAKKRPPTPPGCERAEITTEQWTALVARLEAAEARLAQIEHRQSANPT